MNKWRSIFDNDNKNQKKGIGRRDFIIKTGMTTGFLGGGLYLGNSQAAFGSEDDENDFASSSPEVGPYPHMWQSDDQAPYVEQIGLGLATLKVSGVKQMSLPIWPAFLAIAKEKDPIRSIWEPHGYSPIEPQTEPDPAVQLLERFWLPHVLRSKLKWKSTIVEQDIITLKGTVMTRLRFEQNVNDFYLNGESYKEAHVDISEDGVTVYEDNIQAKPLNYRVSFDFKPSRIELVPYNGVKGGGKKFWKYFWDYSISDLTISVVVDDGSNSIKKFRKRKSFDFSHAYQKQEESWATYFERDVVRVKTPDARINKLIDYLSWIYRSNGLYLGGLCNHRFTMPKQTFWAFWLWDCCFNAIAGRWYNDRDLVWGNILNAPNMQVPDGSESGGCIPNSGNAFGFQIWRSDDPMSNRITIMPHQLNQLDNFGDGSHPPIYAQALEKLWESEGGKLPHRGLLESALRYHDWRERTRASERFPGLLLVHRWSDTGMDNSKRWGHQGSGIYNTRLKKASWSMPIATVDMNVYSVLEKRSLARILKSLGETTKAAKLLSEAEQRVSLIHKYLWSEKVGYYLDYAEKQNMHVPVISPTGAYPLLIEGLSKEHEDGIYNYLMDPKHFFTPAPIPSLSASDPDFIPGRGYINGPSWMCYTAYILHGMFQTRPDEAWKMFDNVLDTLIQDGTPYIFENYNPLTRRYQDCQGFCWQGLFVDLILTDILGLKILNRKLVINNPRTPDHWRSFSIQNAYYNGDTHSFIANRTKNGSW